MPVLCLSSRVTYLQVLLLASLTAPSKASSCAPPGNPPHASALLQRHHRRDSQPVPEFEQRQQLFVHAADEENGRSNLSQSAVPSQVFMGALAEPEDWLTMDNGTAGSLAAATDVGLAAAIAGEPADSAQNAVWRKVASAAQVKQPVSTGFKSAYQPWGRVADSVMPASDNVTAPDLTLSATENERREPGGPTVNNSLTAAVEPGSDASSSHPADATVDSTGTNVEVTLAATNNSGLSAVMVTNIPSLEDNATAVARPTVQNSLVVASKDVHKGQNDGKNVDGDKDKDAKAKDKKAKKDDKTKGDAKGGKEEVSKKAAKGDESKKEASKKEASNEDANEDSGPGAKPAQVSYADAVVGYISRMTALDVVGFGGSAVVMFLFLVLADII